jgi:hypothetical protein
LRLPVGNGRYRAIEVHAGSGYLAQSPLLLPPGAAGLERRDGDGNWRPVPAPQ